MGVIMVYEPTYNWGALQPPRAIYRWEPGPPAEKQPSLSCGFSRPGHSVEQYWRPTNSRARKQSLEYHGLDDDEKIQKYDLKFSLASQASSVKETWASFWRTGMPMACRRMARLQVGELHNWGYSHNFSLSLHTAI